LQNGGDVELERKLFDKVCVEEESPKLVSVREMDDIQVYDKELWEIWNKSKNELVFGPIRAEEYESGHYVARIYRNKCGYWLVKTWIPHFGYSWDEGLVYYLGP
jgi:hypothetical protein